MPTKTMDEKQNGTVTAQQAREALLVEKQQREAACLNAINQALADYNCRLVPVAMIRDGHIVQTMEILAND